MSTCRTPLPTTVTTASNTPAWAARADDRYDRLEYARVGRSGLKLPRISLGLWNNFGHDRPLTTQRSIVLRAFDLGVTHFDLANLANNYGPPPGSAEENFGRILASDLRPYRDELIVSSKAGYDMWPGPYGEWGSRKYLLSSLDASLTRLGLDYVDIFYHHRPDPETPIEESMGALAHAVRSGKALYAGISNYGPDDTRRAAAALAAEGVPLLIHQPSYSMFNRTPEEGLLDAIGELGIGTPSPRRADRASRSSRCSGCCGSRASRARSSARRASPSWKTTSRLSTGRRSRMRNSPRSSRSPYTARGGRRDVDVEERRAPARRSWTS